MKRDFRRCYLVSETSKPGNGSLRQFVVNPLSQVDICAQRENFICIYIQKENSARYKQLSRNNVRLKKKKKKTAWSANNQRRRRLTEL